MSSALVHLLFSFVRSKIVTFIRYRIFSSRVLLASMLKTQTKSAPLYCARWRRNQKESLDCAIRTTLATRLLLATRHLSDAVATSSTLRRYWKSGTQRFRRYWKMSTVNIPCGNLGHILDCVIRLLVCCGRAPRRRDCGCCWQNWTVCQQHHDWGKIWIHDIIDSSRHRAGHREKMSSTGFLEERYHRDLKEKYWESVKSWVRNYHNG